MKEIVIDYRKAFLDISLFGGSIFLSSIPSIFVQFFSPNQLNINLSLFRRILSDPNFVYSFIVGLSVLTIQLLLFEADTKKIQENIIKPFLSLLFFEDIFFILIYNKFAAMDYNAIEQLMKSNVISGGIFEANIVVCISVLLIAISLSIFHSIHSINKKEGTK